MMCGPLTTHWLSAVGFVAGTEQSRGFIYGAGGMVDLGTLAGGA
jgi:probable HAF family extracellular repeat protein